MALPKRPFGRTGLSVSILGIGAGMLGDTNKSDAEVDRFFGTAFEQGINFIDTARGYYGSEDRIGRLLHAKRHDMIISTKGGYGIEGVEDWTGDIITAGIDAALHLLRTDYIDIFHLHSCPLHVLRQDDLIKALQSAKQRGKVRFIAYSGENEELEYAIESGYFDSVQCSVNFCDQRALLHYLPKAYDRGLGVIAKRPAANAPWRFAERPEGQYGEEYWERLKLMSPELSIPLPEAMLRFAGYAQYVSTAIIGTTDASHLMENIEMILRGPLPEETVLYLHELFRKNDNNWIGLI